MIRFFAVVNYMFRKFSFCSNLYADLMANIILLHIFINLKIVFFMKHDPEVKIFIQNQVILEFVLKLIKLIFCISNKVSVLYTLMLPLSYLGQRINATRDGGRKGGHHISKVKV